MYDSLIYILLQELNMADNKKFERMIELLINEDKQGAEELFHEIVVEKSRQIYESILEDEYEIEEYDDFGEDDDEDLMDDWDLEEDDLFDADPMGGDKTDDMIGDVGAGDMGDDDMGDDDMDMDDDEDGMDFGDEDDDSDMQNDIDDIKDEIEDLKSQLEKLIGEKGDDEDMDDMDDMGDDEDMDDMDDMGDDEDEGDEEADDEEENDMPMPPKAKTESKKSAAERMREYVEKVGGDTYDKFGKMGDNGANTKSPVARPNKMGDGSSANIVPGGEAGKGGTQGGLANPSTKDMNTKNVNVPGGKASKAQAKVAKGHGAEKIGDKDAAPNKKSLL